MDFEKLLSFAQQVQQDNTKNVVPKAAKVFSTNLPPPRKEEKKAKGIQSEAVRAFLEKQKREEEEKATKERERKQVLLKAKLEAKRKAEEEKRKEEEDASFIPSNFASGPRKRVGIAITRQNSVVPKVNPCLVKAPNPCLVKAPNPCLVKDSNSEKTSESKRSSADAVKGVRNEKKDEDKHKEKHKHKHKDREKTGHTSKVLADKHGKSTTSALGAKTNSNGGSVKKIRKKHKVKKPSGKPPLSFEQLLEIAQKKHTVPVEMPVVKAKMAEEQRPMTQEEKEQYIRRHSKQYQAWLKFGKKPPAENTASTIGKKKHKPSNEVESSSRHMTQSVVRKSSLDATTRLHDTCKTAADAKTEGKCKPGVMTGSGSAMTTSKQPGTLEKNKPYKLPPSACDPKVRLKNENTQKAPTHSQRGDVKTRVNGFNDGSQQMSKTTHKPFCSTMRKPTHAPSGVDRHSGGAGSGSAKAAHGDGHYIATRETVLRCGAPAKVVKASSVTERVKPVTPWDRIYGEIQKNNPKSVRRKRPVEVDEVEEEDEDSELDEFIADDNEVEESSINYSRYIKDIFGYDKNRFRNERVDDLRDMESSFSQVIKEERMSARLGLKEDLEDIRREEEEKKRKMMKKAKKMKLK